MQLAIDAPESSADLCPDCGGIGAVIVEHSTDPHYGHRYERCHCVTEALRQQWLISSEVTTLKYHDWSFTTYRELPGADLEAVDTVERWVAQGGSESLVLFGESNKGKTALAVQALTARILDHGQRAWFVTCPDLLNHIRAAYDPQSGVRPSEILDRARTVPLLVLDDLGAEQLPRDTSWLAETLYDLIDHRNTHRRPLIVTTNLGTGNGKPFNALSNRLGGLEGQRIAWRLHEMCGGHVVRVQGANQRKGAA